MLLYIMFLCVCLFAHTKYEIAIWDKFGVLGYPQAEKTVDFFISYCAVATGLIGYTLWIQ